MFTRALMAIAASALAILIPDRLPLSEATIYALRNEQTGRIPTLGPVRQLVNPTYYTSPGANLSASQVKPPFLVLLS